MWKSSTDLWQHRDFTKFWAGQTISVFGDNVALIAIPLAATVSLNASVSQMGILTAASRLPWLIVGLFAGVWVDRLRRRPVLLVSDLLRALLIAIIPIAAAIGLLRIELLYCVSFLAGMVGVFFDVAYHAYLPSLVPRTRLVEGNGKLQTSETIAQVAGPGLGGVLVQVLTAPFALIADSLSFLASAISLILIRTQEDASIPRHERFGFQTEVKEGLRHVFGSQTLRAIVAGGGIHNFTTSIFTTVFVVYVTRELAMSAAVFGVILAIGSIGSVLGALVAHRIASVIGIGPAVVVAQFITVAGALFYPVAAGSQIISIVLLSVGQIIWGFSRPVFNINQVSLRQGLTPDRLLGRMTASIRFLMWGVSPIGGIVGGILGSSLGLRKTLIIVILGELTSAIWLLASPMMRMREQPQLEHESIVAE